MAITILLSGFFIHADAATINFTYDSLHRLTAVDSGNGSMVNYSYDAAGNRITQTVVKDPTQASLADLSLSSGTLSPAFVAGTMTYTANVTNTTTSVTVTPTVTDVASTMKVNGVAVSSGSASATIPLAVGANTITVVVSAQDGTTQSTYTVTVTRDGSSSGGYAGWIGSYPSLADITATSDPDHDGISNLLEYVLNGNPSTPSKAILPLASKVSGNFVFTFGRRQASAQDTTQIFQYSPDLSHWTEVSLTGTKGAEVTFGTADGAGVQPVTVTIPQGPNSSMFGRLKVTLP